MTKIRFNNTNGDTKELKLPDTLSFAAIGGVVCGIGGLIVACIIGVISDIISLCNGWE